MHVFKADTKEQLRDEIVKWLDQCASNHRMASRLARRKTFQKEQTLIADTYQDIASFIKRSEIETKS